MLKDDLKTITETDLESFIQNEVPEDKTLEYKREFPLSSKENKLKFLEGISSFANASGGDLVIGIEVDKESKLPIAVIGISISDQPLDEIIRGMDDLIRQGIQPRIPYFTIHPINLKNNNFVIIIRIKKSWIGPHRVTLGSDKFYSRGAAGKYPLDVTELRSAFLLSETRIEKIKTFIINRISDIISNETPVPMPDGAKVILHVIPLAAFDLENTIPLNEKESIIKDLISLDLFPLSVEYNLHGVIKSYIRNNTGNSTEYLQFYRNGIIESVSGDHLISYRDKCIILYRFEDHMIKALDNNLSILKKLNVEPPFLIQISLSNIQGYKLCRSHDMFEEPREIYKDLIQLPETIIENFENPIDKILHNTFDALSNACGLPKSPNYDNDGNWVQKK